MPSDCLALIDIDHIKSFIFAAPYLREIRGSSSLLAGLHDPDSADEIRRRVSRRAGKLLYAGGGSVLAKFPSPAESQAFIDEERLELEKRTKAGAMLTGVIQPIDDGGFGPAILNAQARLRDAKSRRVPSAGLPRTLLLKPCQSCGARPAQTYNSLRRRYVCPACDERIRRGGDVRPLYTRFTEGFAHPLVTSWEGAEVADDLGSLAASSSNYVGVIRADGNAMGDRIRLLAEIGDENLFGDFSAECRKATEESLLDALRGAYPAPRSYRGQSVFPFEFVIIGGDDIEIITTADRAIRVAVRFCDEFTARMKGFAENRAQHKLAVAMSAGVVFAQSSYPISLLDDLSEQLVKSAKARSRRISKDSITPTIDFITVTAATPGSLDAVRSDDYTHDRNRLTHRPYTTEELSQLLSVIKEMKFPSDGGSPFPRNKLQAFYDIFFPFRSKDVSELKYMILLKRLSDKGSPSHRELLRMLNEPGGVQHFRNSPWRKPGEPKIEWDTCLADAVELYEFVSE